MMSAKYMNVSISHKPILRAMYVNIKRLVH